MGYYTRIIFSARLKINDEKIVDVLNWLACGKEEEKPKTLPDHPFFSCERMTFIMCGSDCCSHTLWNFEKEKSCDDMNEYFLSFMSSFKNYSHEIENFLDWIKGYIDVGTGAKGFYAIVCSEDQEEPTIYYLRESE